MKKKDCKSEIETFKNIKNLLPQKIVSRLKNKRQTNKQSMFCKRCKEQELKNI